ncbi:MAG: hypothetical protein RL514_4817, partial [Verrucomicrobiota bacterium]|jgi:pimeloyl-ACP methyl ester carboxylesterase
VTWSLGEFAAAVEARLRAHGIVKGWVLAESFGSQVAWELLAGRGRGEGAGDGREVSGGMGERVPRFRAEGLILAGGFARHPWLAGVRGTEWVLRRAPLGWLSAVVGGYAVVARWRFQQSAEVVAAVGEFRGRWGEELRQAAGHRLRLIAGNDPRELVRGVRVPVVHLTGVFDPVVPWWPVQRWLGRECPGWCGKAVVWPADHNVLSTGTPAAVRLVLGWMGGAGRGAAGVSSSGTKAKSPP